MDRRFPIIPFDAARFSPFIKADEIDGIPQLLTGGACNSNYLVFTKKGHKFVCRIYNRGDPSKEYHLLKRLRGVVPTPDYLWIGCDVSVMPFLEGEHFSPTVALMQNAGRVIGRLSTLLFDSPGDIQEDGTVQKFDGWDSFHSLLLSLIDTEGASRHLDSTAANHLKSILDEKRDLLEAFDRSRNFVHGDFRPDNILVSGDRIVGVLDWEFSHSGSSFMDIGNLLRHLPAYWAKHLAEGLRDEGFLLPADWRYQAYMIDLVSHLEFLTSQRSHAFKEQCARRIEHFIQIHDTDRDRTDPRGSAPPHHHSYGSVSGGSADSRQVNPKE